MILKYYNLRLYIISLIVINIIMENTNFILSSFISLIFLLIKFIQIKYFIKDNTKIKVIFKDTFIVFISSYLGIFVKNNISNTFTDNSTTIFTSPPDF